MCFFRKIISHKHECDFKLINIWFGRPKRVGKYAESSSMFNFYVCKCGKFKITGFADNASFHGKMKPVVNALEDEQKARYLMQYIPKHERQRKCRKECCAKLVGPCLVVENQDFYENEVQANDPIWINQMETLHAVVN